MTTPALQNLEIYQGDSVDMLVRIKARDALGSLVYMDLTDWTPKAQIRLNVGAPTVLAEFTCTKTDQTIMPGGILLHLDPASTASITANEGVWDAEISKSTTDKKTFLAGTVTFTAEVTHV